MRCQARRDRRRGSVLSQAQIPGPLQRSPSGRGAGNEGDGVGCPLHRIPRSEGRASEAHRQGAHAVAKIQTAGRIKRRGCAPGRKWPWHHPRARVPVGLVHHPAGTSRATGQAEASSRMTRQPDPRPVILGPDPRTKDRRRLARETHVSGTKTPNEAPEGATYKYLDRLLLAPRPILGFNPRKVSAHPEGAIPTGGEAWVF